MNGTTITKKIARGLFDLAIYIAIVVSILYGMPKFLSWSLDTPYPMAAITSGSMWPALKEGDLVIIKGAREKKDITVGDIVVFRNGSGSDTKNAFMIHRVIAIRDEVMVTKGDANFDEDSPVPYENLIGKAFNFRGKPVRLPFLGSITVVASNLRQ